MLTHERTYTLLASKIKEKNPDIQVLLGPKQVGKTTILQRLQKTLKMKTIYTTADDNVDSSKNWLEEQWVLARSLGVPCVLMIDEIQKVEGWSDVIKKLRDEQKHLKDKKIKLLLSGSSSLKIQKSLTESLTGRFELILAYHWDYEESKKVFKLNFESFLGHGGYPGSYKFLKDTKRWNNFINQSVIGSVIEKDILQFHTVKSPALFKQTFSLLMSYPAQMISYNKLLGQIQDLN